MKHLYEIHLTVIPECRIYRCHRYFSFLLMTCTQRLYHHCLKNTGKKVHRKIVSDHFYMNLTKGKKFATYAYLSAIEERIVAYSAM